MTTEAPLILVCTDAFMLEQAQSVTASLRADLVSSLDWKDPSLPPFVLVLSSSGLALQQTGKKAPGPVSVEFVSGAVAHRRKFGGGKGQMIAKAVGVKAGTTLQVFDATAGLGRDSFVLATLGCQVTLMERTPVVAELLRDGMTRAQRCEEQDVRDIVSRMTLQVGSSLAYLSQLNEDKGNEGQRPDIVYLDPMFPDRSKSASVKKEMAVFHSLVGKDEDADALLPAAQSVARYRVVVKRPNKAPFLNNQPPTYQLTGKTSRYDIYVNKKIP